MLLSGYDRWKLASPDEENCEPDTRRCEVCEEDVDWEDTIPVDDTTTDGEAYMCTDCAKTNLL